MKNIKYFTKEEFTCKCGCGLNNINYKLVQQLDNVRTNFKHPIIIVSGCRCINHNQQIGGKSNSAHLLGLAVDIKCISSKLRFNLINILLKNKFTRIGISKTFIHVDIMDDYKKQNVIWVY